MATHKQIKGFNPFDHPICISIPGRLTPSTTSWHQHIPFAMALVDLIRPGIIVELGTHYGDSYCAFCQAVAGLKLTTSCYAVDSWEGDSQSGLYGPEVLADLKNHHDTLYSGFSRLIQSTFDDAVEHFTDGSIDVLHIDGYHTYDSVKHDFTTWLPKLKPGGVVLFHDTNVRERDFGVRKFWEEMKLTAPHFEFLHSEGLGILAPGKIYPKGLQFLFVADEAATAVVRNTFFLLGDRVESYVNRNMLTDTLSVKDTEIQSLVHKIHIANLEREIEVKDKEQRLLNKDFELQAIVQKVNNTEHQIQVRDQQIQQYVSEINDLTNTTRDLGHQLYNKNIEIDVLVQKVNNKEREIQARRRLINEREAEIQARGQVIRGQEAEISKLAGMVSERDATIQQIMSGVVMKLMIQYKLTVDRLLRPGSKIHHIYELAFTSVQIIASQGVRGFWRKYRDYRGVPQMFSLRTKTSGYYELGSAGVKTIANEGFGAFWRNFKRYQTLRKKNSRIKIKPLKFKPLLEDPSKALQIVERTVSIVIPTKNAGIDFDFTLAKIRSQKGIREIEIVVVDSGSDDATVSLASKHDAKVYAIDPGDFNHGLTRNYGAGQANGDYVLFMVQDAIPIGDFWLYDMVNVLEGDNQIAAVTCRQVPRSDADLFACASLCNHNRALIFSHDGVASTTTRFKDLSPIEKRRLAGLDNVCSLIRKDIFDKFKFTDIRYAEDLQLGLKMRENDYNLAFLYWTGVIHSHNRSASYLLKRGYVDAKLLVELLAYEPVAQYGMYADVKDMISAVKTLYAALNVSIVSLGSYSDNVRRTIQRLKSLLQVNLSSDPSRLKNFERSGQHLDRIFEDLRKITGDVVLKSNDSLAQSYFDGLDHFTGYVRAYNTIKDKENEFVDAMYKIFAIVAGHALSDYYLLMRSNGKISSTLESVDSILSEGV